MGREHDQNRVNMKQKVTNFGKFYALLKQMPGSDVEQVKENLVWQFTGMRTYSLREMKAGEYEEMTRYMQGVIDRKPDERTVKKLRSGILHRLQRHGVNTTNWDEVNRFLLNPRIAGKMLFQMNVEEMRELTGKLESILDKDTKRQQDINRLIALN